MSDLNLMYSHGHSFLLAGERCAELRWITETSCQALLIPAVTNYTFSCEVFIKLISLASGEKITGHELKKLFDQLPQDKKNEIIQEVGLEQDKFYKELERASNGFVTFRYLYEKSEASSQMNFVVTFAKALGRIAEKHCA